MLLQVLGLPLAFLAIWITRMIRTLGGILLAVLAHPDGGLMWLGAPVLLWRVRRLFWMATSRLADGRTAISQNFDDFFAGTCTPGIAARSASDLELEGFIDGHRNFIAELGSPPVVEDEELTLDPFSGLMARHREALIEQGQVVAVTDEVALPRLGFIVRRLKAYLQMTKAPAESGPIPSELLTDHFSLVELLSERAPLRRIEVMLVVSSIFTFGLAGWLLWDAKFAIGLLIVILVHELGHYIAMRVQGYRSVHLLALPLVGGVTMGRDPHPSANRQAWMSLMGPLPGIGIGIVMMGVGAVTHSSPDSWLGLTAILFLVVNYLNLVPVLPLDGGQVLQALIPSRHAKVRTVVLAAIGLAGALGAAFAEFWIISVIFVLPLLSLKHRWQLHEVEADLARQAPPGRAHDATSPLAVLQAMERHMSPADSTKRAAEALALRDRLRTEPMSLASGLAVGGAYLFAFVGPLVLLVGVGFMGGGFGLFSEGFEGFEGVGDAEYDKMRAQVEAMSTRELLEVLHSPETPLPEPATPIEISQAETRLGHALPAELLDLYTAANGVPALQIKPIAAVRTATPAELFQRSPVSVDGRQVDLHSSELKTLWHIGAGRPARYYWVDPNPEFEATRLVFVDTELGAHLTSLSDLISMRAEGQLLARYVQALHKERLKTAAAALKHASIAMLLDKGYGNGDLFADSRQGRADGASLATIRAAEQRLARALPPQLKTVLAIHDPPGVFGLLSSTELVAYREVSVRPLPPSAATATLAQWGGVRIIIPDSAALSDCLVVAGHIDRLDGLQPQLIWCPSRPEATQWIDRFPGYAYPDLHSWLVSQAAEVTMWQ